MRAANDDPLIIRSIEVPGLDSRVRVFRCLDFVDSFAVLTQRFLVLVDTLVSPAAARQVMHLLQAAPNGAGTTVLVVNTHGDWDHVWGNALFDGAAAEFQAPIIGRVETSRGFDRQRAQAFLEDSQSRHPEWYADVEFRMPTLEIDRGLTIYGGDLTLELIPTEGHTPDHLSVWIPEIRVLIAGDAAELPMPFVDNPAGLPQLRSSLKRMFDLRPATVLYCHARGISSPDLIAHNIWYFDEAERRCRAFVAERPGYDPSQITPEALGWTLEDSLPVGTQAEDLLNSEFYRDSHARAIKAVAQQLPRHLGADGG